MTMESALSDLSLVTDIKVNAQNSDREPIHYLMGPVKVIFRQAPWP